MDTEAKMPATKLTLREVFRELSSSGKDMEVPLTRLAKEIKELTGQKCNPLELGKFFIRNGLKLTPRNTETGFSVVINLEQLNALLRFYLAGEVA